MLVAIQPPTELEVPLPDDVRQLQQLQSQDNGGGECPNDVSVSSELSLDILSRKDNSSTCDNEDSSLGDSLGDIANGALLAAGSGGSSNNKNHKDDDEDKNNQSTSSSSSCRGWNPDDSDYSLNVLLPPTGSGGDNDSADGGATTVSKDSLFGSDYSLNKLRSRAKKPGKVLTHSLSISSTHSTVSMLSMSSSSSLDAFEGDGSNGSFAVPEDIALGEASSSSSAQQKQMEPPKPILSSGKDWSCTEEDGEDATKNKKKKKKGSRRNKVKFYPRVKIQRVTPRKKLPKEQFGAVWYSRVEFTAIRQECFDTIRMMSDDDEIYEGRADEIDPLYDEDENELCRRGLEYKTPRAYKHRQRQKKDIRTVVFDEQDFQEESGMNDPEWLAKLSYDQSESCVKTAVSVAVEDERQARIYLYGHE
eukprot:CAMPEP_0113484444 /NCGR_PEP_ID=MMETSP0014_2-20120614/23964_1 /TAXON_ID=2857 /ORGANISM="Nitzschia sp." /LENGTH=418 /DNA_ID=CAMNT_0000378045 /DNA_START=84 /DNA_END=1340 /DNA_ORIENTATION=- /assembly_acc=CAM_ASM_000159